MLPFIFAVVFSIAAASPLAGEVDKRADSKFCSTVKKQNCKPTATAYCSSYLSISRATTTVTTTVAGGTSTVTVTADAVYETATITISSCALPQTPAAKAKRALKKPACLSKYTARTQISSACRCLSPTPSTTTVTSTVNGAGATQTTTITPTTTYTEYEIPPAATADFNIFARYGGDIDGTYAVADTQYPQFNSDQSGATTWQLSGSQLIASSGPFAGDGNYAGITIVEGDVENTRRVYMSTNGGAMTCRIVYDSLGCYLSCSAFSYSYDTHCGNGYWAKAGIYPAECSGFRPYVVTP